MYRFFYNSITNPQHYKTALIRADLDKFDLFGDDYLFEWLQQCSVEKAYKTYITDTLKIIAENTAEFAGGGAPTVRWADMIEPKPKDTRTDDEIIADINKKCGLTMIDDGGE